jgi:uncharacterized protein Yka (UPF0111/DUF47 family)
LNLDDNLDISSGKKSKVEEMVDKINNKVKELDNERKSLWAAQADIQTKEHEIDQITKELNSTE